MTLDEMAFACDHHLMTAPPSTIHTQHTHACVAGVGGAEKGTLSFMVGGSETDFERARPVLEHMG